MTNRYAAKFLCQYKGDDCLVVFDPCYTLEGLSYSLWVRELEEGTLYSPATTKNLFVVTDAAGVAEFIIVADAPATEVRCLTHHIVGSRGVDSGCLAVMQFDQTQHWTLDDFRAVPARKLPSVIFKPISPIAIIPAYRGDDDYPLYEAYSKDFYNAEQPYAFVVSLRYSWIEDATFTLEGAPSND